MVTEFLSKNAWFKFHQVSSFWFPLQRVQDAIVEVVFVDVCSASLHMHQSNLI